ncbi:MAG: rhombosortase [Gammaproteobacteria bacterium]|jgi:rhomboid family GlyGly-CTERM serine protease|nr:rhombosortase [Gammaproteobacteria bacterium]MBT5202457.1 rhombosortase [Gammaproteobacteria bacterium]MBT5601346.1 rhombosortase [Gammaproteobacteria bacterium]MBT6246773.1 rhombosortase [Gammaproteobacteria bacterium]
MNRWIRSQDLPIHGFVVVLLVLGFFHETINALLEYNYLGITQGQIWRLLSGHFVHLNVLHAALNSAGLVLCIAIFGSPRNLAYSCIYLIIMALFISSGLFIFSPNVAYYLGFSGLLHAVTIHYLVLGYNKNRFFYGLALVGMATKLALEQSTLFDVFYLQTLIGDQVINESHLYGAIGALLWVILRQLLTQLDYENPAS